MFIGLAGRSLSVGKRNIAVAVSQFGYIHIRVIDRPLCGDTERDRTVIVRLQPKLTSGLMVVAAAHKIADLYPQRTIVIADFANPKCWVFLGCLPALYKMATLVGDRGETDISSSIKEPVRPV